MKAIEKFHTKKQFNKLLDKIFLEEKDAFEEFYNVYGKFIKVKANTILKNDCLADEVVNDVLVKVWKASATKRDIENPPGWVYTITVNCAKDKLKAEKTYYDIYDIPYDDENIDKVISDDTFYTQLEGLNETEKDILILKIIQKLPFKVIGKIKEMPCSTVSSLYYRALNKIKLKKF